MAELYASALQQLAETRIDGRPAEPLPPACAITLSDLLANPVSVSELVPRLG